MTQYAVIDALEGDKKPMEDMVATFGRRRAFMLEKLEKMKEYGFDYVKPDGAFYAMLLCDNLYEELRRAQDKGKCGRCRNAFRL